MAAEVKRLKVSEGATRWHGRACGTYEPASACVPGDVRGEERAQGQLPHNGRWRRHRETGPGRDTEDLREGAEQHSHAHFVRRPKCPVAPRTRPIAASHTAPRRGRCLSLWSHDGYRLFDKADILPLVDHDSHVIACDKETFPSEAVSRKRSAPDADDEDVSPASDARLPCAFAPRANSGRACRSRAATRSSSRRR